MDKQIIKQNLIVRLCNVRRFCFYRLYYSVLICEYMYFSTVAKHAEKCRV